MIEKKETWSDGDLVIYTRPEKGAEVLEHSHPITPILAQVLQRWFGLSPVSPKLIYMTHSGVDEDEATTDTEKADALGLEIWFDEVSAPVDINLYGFGYSGYLKVVLQNESVTRNPLADLRATVADMYSLDTSCVFVKGVVYNGGKPNEHNNIYWSLNIV